MFGTESSMSGIVLLRFLRALKERSIPYEPKKKNKEPYRRENIRKDGRQFALLSFNKIGDRVLNDKIVADTVAKENLRPVSIDEFEFFCHRILKNRAPKKVIVAFGNTAYNEPITEGGLPGVPCLNKKGQVEIVGDWTRAEDQWSYECKFIFVPL
jgi:hypothetical protein